MQYFGGIELWAAEHAPACSTWIDRSFTGFALNFAASGTLRWQTPAGRVVELEPPVAFWTRPGVHFRYGCDRGEAWDQRYVSFRGPRAERMRRKGLLPASDQPWQTVRDCERFAAVFDRLIGWVSRPGPTTPRAVHLLEGMLLDLAEGGANRLPDDPIEAVIAGIRERPEAMYDFEAVARAYHLSLVQFRRRFKALVGLPPTAFVIRCRMHRAAELLRQTREPASVIGERVGCPDPYHFSKLFKKHYGLPPLAYRREVEHTEPAGEPGR
ncbi:MAG: AraC family transcriptional regulator [Planctomycetota bacterium]